MKAATRMVQAMQTMRINTASCGFSSHRIRFRHRFPNLRRSCRERPIRRPGSGPGFIEATGDDQARPGVTTGGRVVERGAR